METDAQRYSDSLILYHLACSVLEKLEKEYGLTAAEKVKLSEALGKRRGLVDKSIFTI
nr:MAG TPA: hypothetical protein [Caudoviricetes sp.]